MSNMIADLVAPSLKQGKAEGSIAIADAELGARLVLGVLRQALVHFDSHGRPEGIEITLAHIVLRMLGTPEALVSGIVDRTVESLGGT